MNAETHTNQLSPSEERKKEREMLDATHGTLKSSKEVPSWTDPTTGIDVRNFEPSERKKFGVSLPGDEKDTLAVYPAEGDDAAMYYLRSMKTGGIRSGHSTRAYVVKQRDGKREGQNIQVTTDYNSKAIDDWDSPKGSETHVIVYDNDGNTIREREHTSEGVGLSPLVTKIVTQGIDAQIQKIKDGEGADAETSSGDK